VEALFDEGRRAYCSRLFQDFASPQLHNESAFRDASLIKRRLYTVVVVWWAEGVVLTVGPHPERVSLYPTEVASNGRSKFDHRSPRTRGDGETTVADLGISYDQLAAVNTLC
jgi:hypothetical protein